MRLRLTNKYTDVSTRSERAKANGYVYNDSDKIIGNIVRNRYALDMFGRYMGFVTYNGMTAEQFAWVWIRSKFIEPRKVKFECDTFYHGSGVKSNEKKHSRKEAMIAHDEITQKYAEEG